MREAGLIDKQVTLLNPEILGLGVTVVVELTLKRQDEESLIKFERAVNLIDHVLECYAMTGDMDFLLHILAPDLASFSDFAMKALLRMPGVRGTRSSFIMQAIKSDLAWAPQAAPQSPASVRK